MSHLNEADAERGHAGDRLAIAPCVDSLSQMFDIVHRPDPRLRFTGLGIRPTTDSRRVGDPLYSLAGGSMTAITPDQRQAAAEAGDVPIELVDPQNGDSFVLVRADVFRRMHALFEDREDRLEHEAWAALSRKTRDRWAAENPS